MLSSSAKQIYIEISPTNKLSFGLDDIWRYRELFLFFAWRDIKVKYKQTALGVLWVVLQPLALMAVFTLVFSRGLKVNSELLPYPLFAFSGLLIWSVFSNGLLNSANSMIANANIIRKIYFPRLIIPISAILTALFDFCFSLVIFICVILYFHKMAFIGLTLIRMPLAIALTVFTTIGLGTFLGALNVKYRDFQYFLPFLIQFLLFANPVLYSSHTFRSPSVIMLMKCNPIAASIDLIRASLSGTGIDRMQLLLSSIVAVSLMLIGILTFRNTEKYFADLA